MAELTREAIRNSEPKLARQWLSGVAGVLLLTSVVSPLWDEGAPGASTVRWDVRSAALVLGVVMLALFIWNPRRDQRVALAIGVIGVVLIWAALTELWNMGWAPALLLSSIALSLFVWNLKRPWVVGLAIGALLIWIALTTLWLFFNNAHYFATDSLIRFTPRIGYFVYWAGLGVTAIAGIAYAFPDRRHD